MDPRIWTGSYAIWVTNKDQSISFESGPIAPNGNLHTVFVECFYGARIIPSEGIRVRGGDQDTQVSITIMLLKKKERVGDHIIISGLWNRKSDLVFIISFVQWCCKRQQGNKKCGPLIWSPLFASFLPSFIYSLGLSKRGFSSAISFSAVVNPSCTNEQLWGEK